MFYITTPPCGNTINRIFLMSILLPRPAGTPSKIEGELRPRRFFVRWPETVCLRALGLAGSTVNRKQSTVNRKQSTVNRKQSTVN